MSVFSSFGAMFISTLGQQEGSTQDYVAGSTLIVKKMLQIKLFGYLRANYSDWLHSLNIKWEYFDALEKLVGEVQAQGARIFCKMY